MCLLNFDDGFGDFKLDKFQKHKALIFMLPSDHMAQMMLFVRFCFTSHDLPGALQTGRHHLRLLGLPRQPGGNCVGILGSWNCGDGLMFMDFSDAKKGDIHHVGSMWVSSGGLCVHNYI